MADKAYSPHKTFNLVEDKTLASTSVVAEKKAEPVKTEVPVTSSNATSPAAVVTSAAVAGVNSVINTPVADIKQTEITNTKTVQAQQNVNVATNVSQAQIKNINSIYPDHKSFSFINNSGVQASATVREKEVVAPQITVPEKKEETKNVVVPPPIPIPVVDAPKPPVVNTAPKDTSVTDNKNTPVTSAPTVNKTVTVNVKGNYPSHKTFVIGVDDYKAPEPATAATIPSQPVSPVVVDSIKKEENVIIENKPPVVAPTTKVESATPPPVKQVPKQVVNNTPQKADATATKGKKPVLWIILTGVFFLLLAGAGWYVFQQQQQLSAMAKANEDLKESVKRNQKDKLHFDDIIAGGGKLDDKQNIVLLENAKEIEVIRTCFSIAENINAKQGKKEVYIRLLDSKNNVLEGAGKNNFEYKGEQIPFTIKKEVEYVNEEMMLWVDYKLNKKLTKGKYKVEIYNDGVLDGEASFELK